MHIYAFEIKPYLIGNIYYWSGRYTSTWPRKKHYTESHYRQDLRL